MRRGFVVNANDGVFSQSFFSTHLIKRLPLYLRNLFETRDVKPNRKGLIHENITEHTVRNP